MKRLILFLFPLLLVGCRGHRPDPYELVDPFVGTTGGGNTFFGASLPFGMVKLGPWLRYDDGGAGGVVRGFSHTHVSGMAGGGNGAPGEVIFLPLSVPPREEAPLAVPFRHDHEEATPATYHILLDDGTDVRLAATLRTGMMRITFAGDTGILVVRGRRGWLHAGAATLTGFSDRVRFHTRFSRPWHLLERSTDTVAATGEVYPLLILRFALPAGTPLFVATGISWVDTAGARGNLEAELRGTPSPRLFDSITRAARRMWQQELGRITIEGGTDEQQILFYTSLYHAFMHPNIFMDADGRYRSTNGRIYRARDFDNYTNFSLWDTFRALHPLFTIIQRERTVQFIRTFLARYDHTGRMLIMEFDGTEGDQPPMIAYHSLPVIADAYVKGIRSFDTLKALTAMKALADDLHRKGKQLYLDYGFIPCDLKGQSVSRTLEYCYDDWCVTRLAPPPGDSMTAIVYGQRGDQWRNLFDTSVHFMRGRRRNFTFDTPFDPDRTVNHYTEANAWQYTTFVPHDLYGLIDLMGGDSAFIAWLDSCFTHRSDPSKVDVRDVTGLIGQYAHGNEPSHHMAYLYNHAGAPWKTQAMVRRILTTLYHRRQDGLAGNEDCGQMSAWYVMSAMGLYAVTPGLPHYELGSPLFDRVTLHLENGRTFTVAAHGNGPGRPYIRAVLLNGRPWERSYLPADSLLSGGLLELWMDDRPHPSRAVTHEARPPAAGHRRRWSYPPVPSFSDIYFSDTLTVRLTPARQGDTLRYTLDGTLPDRHSLRYRGPLLLRQPLTLTLRAYHAPLLPSRYRRIRFHHIVTLEGRQPPCSPVPGLHYHLVDRPVENATTVKTYPVTRSGITRKIRVDLVKDERPFGEWFEGYLLVPEGAIYTFAVEANDGAILYLDGHEVVNNDGGHRAQKLDMKVRLQKGWHHLEVRYFQQGLAKKLRIYWQHDRHPEQEIPPGALFHCPQ